MRIFETFVVALLVVLMFAFVLNKKLNAGDKDTAKLEEKLETAFKQLKQHTAQLEQLKEREKKLVAGLKEGNKVLLATLKKRDKELVADLDDLQKYDVELAAWLKKRDKALAADLNKWEKRTTKERKALDKNFAALHDFVQRLQDDVRKEDERLSRKLTSETTMAFNASTNLATELCANMIVHYGRITHKHYPRPAGATVGNDAVLHEPAPRDLKSILKSILPASFR